MFSTTKKENVAKSMVRGHDCFHHRKPYLRVENTMREGGHTLDSKKGKKRLPKRGRNTLVAKKGRGGGGG